jgi:hypothetical protein
VRSTFDLVIPARTEILVGNFIAFSIKLATPAVGERPG